ncbi:MAG: STAS domain-containing protein [Actinomycetota bacterium]|nr:STAS domain-containing protein [Actinomycetota bacterium]
MDLRLTERTVADLTIRGRIDALAAIDLRRELRDLREAGRVDVTADLSEVTELDVAGLAALVRAMRDLRAAGGDLTVVLPRADGARRMLRLSRFDRILTTTPARPVPGAA